MPACRLGAQQQAARCPGHLNVRRAPLSLLRKSTCNLQHRSIERTRKRANTTENAASSSYEDRSTAAEERATSSDGSSSDAEGAPVQFEIHRIAGDGSCLFRAVAQGTHHVSTGALLTGRELFEAGFGLRREVCGEMVRRKEEIEPFIPGVFDAYVSNMSLEGIWGGEPELAVAIHCIRRPIIVYREVKSGIFGKDLEKVSEYGAQEYPGVSPVCLLFSGCHYDLLMQVLQ